MDERLRAIIALRTQEKAEFHGDFVDVDPVHSWPKPVQRPHPPIYVGGSSERTFARVAEYGSAWLPSAIPPAELGAHIARSLAGHDWLAARDDAALAASRLVTAADITEERYLTPGAADPNIVILRQGDGLGRGVQASSPLAALVGACDGELSVGQIVGALASLFDVPADDLAAELLPAVRRLVRDGFLAE